MEKIRRVNITFWFDDTKVSERELCDRLDALLVDRFSDLEDWDTRWVSDLADSPVFGAALEKLPQRSEKEG